jgi:hypothetical protein
LVMLEYKDRVEPGEERELLLSALVWGGPKVEISGENARRHPGIIIEFLHLTKLTFLLSNNNHDA